MPPKLLKLPYAIPFFIAIFLNAFIDLGHKIVVQNIVFKLFDEQEQIIYTGILNALILIPFIALLSPAGYVSDRFSRTSVMRKMAQLAVLLCSAITLCYYMGWFIPAFMLTLLLASQSAFYSPAKLAYLRDLFGKERLGEANGIASALSIIAILFGIFAFSIGFEVFYAQNEQPTSAASILHAVAPMGWLLIASSLLELYLVHRLPQQERSETHTQTFSTRRWLTGRCLKADLSPFIHSKAIRLSIIGLATFWGVGQVMLAAFPAFAKTHLLLDNTVYVQGILACSGLGIALGAFVSGRVSKDHIELGLLPFGALGIAAGLLFLPTAGSAISAAFLFLFIGFSGGIFIVPLNALIQFHAKSEQIGTTVAANNWVQNVVMLAFLSLTVLFAVNGWDSRGLLYIISGVALIGGCYTLVKLPQSFTRFLFTLLFSRHYRVNVQGLKKLPTKGGVLLLGNHISWVDWAIIQIASPRPVRFVMTRNIYQRRYLKWFFDLFGTIPIDANRGVRASLTRVAEQLNAGEVVCLFPEGTLSRTGNMVAFQKGYERACEHANDSVVIVPFYIRGLWGSRFSYSSEYIKDKQKSFGIGRELVVAFGEPLAKSTGKAALKQKIRELSISSWNEYVSELPTLDEQWIETSKRFGGRQLIEDITGAALNGSTALVGSLCLSRRIKKQVKGQNVGLMLPSSVGGAMANMAALLAGKTVVNLNYTAGTAAIGSAIKQSELTVVYTSRQFIKKLAQRGISMEALFEHCQWRFLEDIKTTIRPAEKLSTLLITKIVPSRLLKRIYKSGQNNESTAFILFSSGSEGAPKGVMLSHKNVMANVKQITDVLNFEHDDVMFANLPLFHAFGLTATFALPMLEGIPTICHPDPTDALGNARAIFKGKATIFIATATFLRLYTKNGKVHPRMLESLRYVVSGAEKLTENVRVAFSQKFHKVIYEGYGMTEATPVVSVNLPDQIHPQDLFVQRGTKIGTVGIPLPGTSCKIVDPDTFQPLPTGEAGMILVGGEQIMQGYLNQNEKTQAVIKEMDGIRWYMSGDKGCIDEDGFLTIHDRYSRFAKIGGEMLSLSHIENCFFHVCQKDPSILPSFTSPRDNGQDAVLECVALNIPDEKKGEKIVLLCNHTVDEMAAKKALLDAGVANLAIPYTYLTVPEIPKLGSGKTHYVACRDYLINNISV